MKKKPGDRRPRHTIDAGREWLKNEMTMTQARKAAFASHSAARRATDHSAGFAARAAGHAAVTAHVRTHAVHAATYVAKAIFFSALPNKDAEVDQERKWPLEQLLKLPG